MLRHFFRGDASLIFRRAQLHASDQPAKILISRPRFDENWIAISAGGRDFGADVCANFVFQRGVMKARRSIQPVAIEQRHCRKLNLRGAPRQSFGKGSAFEKAESRSRVEFDVHFVPPASCRLLSFSGFGDPKFRARYAVEEFLCQHRWKVLVVHAPDEPLPTRAFANDSIYAPCPRTLRLLRCM